MSHQNKIISLSPPSSTVAAPLRYGIAWLVMALLALCAGPAAAQTLTHRYSFTGGSSVTNAIDSVGAANGTFVGAAQVQSNALVLDGASAVSLPAGIINSTYTNGLTIEAWANVTRTLDGYMADLFGFGTSDFNNYLGVTLHDGNDDAEIEITTNAVETLGNQPGPVSGNVHLAGVWDAVDGIMLWYVDGNVWCTNMFFPAMMSDVIGSSNQVNIIGSHIDGTDGMYGTIDEFRIYNGTLTLAQIRSSIAAGPDAATAFNFGTITNVSVSVNSIFIVGTWEDPAVLASSATVTNINLTTAPQVAFTSGNTNILLVMPNGQVQAVGAGTTTLTATYEGVHGQTTVTTLPVPTQAVMTHRYSFTSDASDSISGENGVLMGNAAVNTAAAPHALDLTQSETDGLGRGNFLNLPRDVIDGYPKVTLEYWVDLQNNSGFCRIWSSGSFFPAGSDSSAFILSPFWGNPNDSLVCLLNPQVGTDAGDQHAVIAGDVDNAGLTQIVGVCDTVNGTITIYTNGVLGNSVTTTYSLLTVTNQHVVVGESLGLDNPYINGTIDEIRVYYGDVSSAQVGADYLAGPDSTNGTPGALLSIIASIPANLTVGEQGAITVAANYANVTNVDITSLATFASSNSAVVSVSSNGVVTGVAAGSATVTASFGGLNSSQLVTVMPASVALLMDRYSFTTDASDSVGTNNGTLFGDAVVQSNALVLDGAAYVSLPAGTITPNYTALTIEMFANVQRTADGTPTVIAYFGTSGSAPTTSYCRIVTKANSCNCWTGYAADDNGEYRVWPPGPIAGNVHLVAVWNPANGYLLFYKNGFLLGSNTIPAGNPLADMAGTNDQECYIGANQDAGIPPIGTIDEFRIYNGELTIDQIRASIAAGPDHIPLIGGTINPGAITSVSVSVHSDFIVGTVADPIVTANTATVTNINLTLVPDVAFTSDNTNVLVVRTNNQIQAMGAGTTTLTATYQGISNSTSVTTIPVPTRPLLTHRYSFTSDASDSVSGENGTLLGGAVITSNSLDLTGNGDSGNAGGTSGAYLGLPRDVITGYPAVTVEMWANLGPDAGSSRLFDVGSYFGGSGDSSAFILSPSWNGTSTELVINPQVGTDAGNDQAVYAELLAGLGEVQIVGVATPDVLQLYLNGLLVGSGTNTYSLLSVSNQFATVGQSYGQNNPYVDGTIDEVRLYYGALSAGQIAADNTAGPKTVVPPLMVALSGQSLLISWPASSAGFGFTLESSPALSGPTENWQPVSGTQTQSGGFLTVSVPLTGSARFFRLVN